MNGIMEQKLTPDSMEKASAGCIVFHEGKYWVAEERPTRGTYLYLLHHPV